MPWQWSVIPVWLVVCAGVVAALLRPAGERIQWLSIVLVASVLLTFLAQLATRQPAGFLDRARLSMLGAVLPLAVGGLITLIG